PAGCNAGESGGRVLAVCPTLGNGQAMRVVFTGTATQAGQDLVNTFTWSADSVAGETPGGTCVNAPCGGSAPQPKARAHKRGEDATANGGFFTGDTVRYTLRLTNTMAVTQTNVRITDALPMQLSLAGVGVPSGCRDQSSGNTAVVVCGEVAPSATVVVVISATVNASAAGQTITNTFTWSSDQGSGGSDPCVNVPCGGDEPVRPEPPIGPLVATKQASDETDNGAFYVGDVVRYTLTVRNDNVVTFTNVRLTDVVPSLLRLLGVQSVSAGCVDQSSGSVVRVTCAELPPGGIAEVVFTAQVRAEAAGQAIVNLFRWTAEPWIERDNSSNVCINAPCGGDAPTRGGRGHKRGVGELSAGALVTYTLSVTNQTRVTLTNVRITDVLPVELSLVGVGLPGGCTDESSGNTAVVHCATLAAGQGLAVEVYATVVTATAELVNRFSWTADNLYPPDEPECWSLPCDSDEQPELNNSGTAKVAHAERVRVGDLVSYTLVLSNTGAVAARATVTDALDGRMTFVTASVVPEESAGGVLVWRDVLVPAGQAVRITVTVRAGANTPLHQSYRVVNAMTVSYRGQSLARQAEEVEVNPYRAFLPIVRRPSEHTVRVFVPIVRVE
ncbi:MAG: hypothetical protein RMJ86_10630, partial [Anaerolineae bacterium]|nr:hypothetical protein [Anaerolineae bacterium]